ncbi:MAG TPA: MBL fold metallo-hydrolase [Nitrososphaeraceae archaeon]|jgi:glyoxylase-like metal-dependent hydrolase (beta-lactamase superfamily II)
MNLSFMQFNVLLPWKLLEVQSLALTALIILIYTVNLGNNEAVAQRDYDLQEIKDGIYVLSADGYNVMYMPTGEGVIVIDAPPSIGDKIFRAISEVTNEPIKYLIYSHAHKDHIGAAHLFVPSVEIIAETNTADVLNKANDPERPVPTRVFVDNTTLTVANKTLHLIYPGQYHQRGNIFIYIPDQRVLMAVDQLTPDAVPYKHLAATPEVPALMRSYDQALAYNFDIYVPGHGKTGTREDVKVLKEYVTDLNNNSQFAINNINFTEATKNVDKQNNAAVTEAYFNALTNVCVDRTEEKWKGKLQGVGVWTDEHCEKMIQSLRVD